MQQRPGCRRTNPWRCPQKKMLACAIFWTISVRPEPKFVSKIPDSQGCLSQKRPAICKATGGNNSTVRIKLSNTMQFLSTCRYDLDRGHAGAFQRLIPFFRSDTHQCSLVGCGLHLSGMIPSAADQVECGTGIDDLSGSHHVASSAAALLPMSAFARLSTSYHHHLSPLDHRILTIFAHSTMDTANAARGIDPTMYVFYHLMGLLDMR